MRRVVMPALALLIVNSGYLVAFPRASVFYMANVLLHLALGLALMAVAAGFVKRYPRPSAERFCWRGCRRCTWCSAATRATIVWFYGCTSPWRWWRCR